MQHVHYELQSNGGDVVLVSISQQANVLLLDTANYHAYCRGGQYRYHGGWRKMSPVRLSVPHSGQWHIAIDLAGRNGSIQTSVRLL